jgi:hypothetical protein
MRIAYLLACIVTIATPAFAIIAPTMPQAMEQAPVERALENVAHDERLAPAQRERLLGRLHLIAYAQMNVRLTRYANGEWQPPNQGPCGDRAYAFPGEHLCPFGYMGLSVLELPTEVSDRAFMATGHLRQAREHYQRALTLDEPNLRAQLGLAYVLDQLGEDDAARVHLRRIIELSSAAFTGSGRGEYVEWEEYAVLNEAVEHLGNLARSRADRALVADLRQRLGSARPTGWVTPIVVPLRDAPFEALTDDASPVAFDLAGTGDTRAQGWLTADAAWLVWDPNRRGDVRSGFDMLGQRTWAVFWTDGFEAMRSLDDNGDGELTGAELGGLALWRDVNVNGASDAGEVAPVSDFGVIALAVRGAMERPGLITAPGGVRFADGTQRPLYDWTPGVNASPTS